ncbi:hypothetical protein AWENTII_006976 [Aspergillus wentii]
MKNINLQQYTPRHLFLSFVFCFQRLLFRISFSLFFLIPPRARKDVRKESKKIQQEWGYHFVTDRSVMRRPRFDSLIFSSWFSLLFCFLSMSCDCVLFSK